MTESNHTTGKLTLPPVLDASAAADLLDSLRQSVGHAEPLYLDASGVETLTYPCVQVLMSAFKSCEQVFVHRPSAAFASVFEDLGLSFRHCDAAADDVASATEAASSDQLHSAEQDAEIEQCGNTKRILTIDDSKTMRDMLRLTLADAGFDVVQAIDGQDGLDVLDKDEQGVDVIITDINMPRMDGYEVIRHLRVNPAHKGTPILVLTTESDSEKRNIAREAGATGWMVKPFDPERLIETVRKVAP